MKNIILTLILIFLSTSAFSKEIGEVTTSGMIFKDTIVIHSFKDPTLQGVACHVTTPDKSFSFEDPTDSAIACRQVSEIIKGNYKENKKDVFSSSKGLFFKVMRVDRFYDKELNTLVYISYVRKSSGDNAAHSLSTVPLYAAKIIE